MLTMPFPNDLHFLLSVILVLSFLDPLLKIPVFFLRGLISKINLSTDQYSTPPTTSCVDYHLFAKSTLVTKSSQDPRFLYIATHKLNSTTYFSD